MTLLGERAKISSYSCQEEEGVDGATKKFYNNLIQGLKGKL